MQVDTAPLNADLRVAPYQLIFTGVAHRPPARPAGGGAVQVDVHGALPAVAESVPVRSARPSGPAAYPLGAPHGAPAN